jgi:hypothetical protein
VTVFLNSGPVRGHSITGATREQASGKQYIHYHRASQGCPERSKTVNQDMLFERLHGDGVLSDQEFAEVKAIRERALQENKVEIVAYQEADLKTCQQGLRVIELLGRLPKYMSLVGNSLEMVRLAKKVLMNPILQDRTFRTDYPKTVRCPH